MTVKMIACAVPVTREQFEPAFLGFARTSKGHLETWYAHPSRTMSRLRLGPLAGMMQD